MTEVGNRAVEQEWLPRWRLARGTVAAAMTWILTLPLLARLLRWHRNQGLPGQDVFAALSGLVWGRIGWIGVRRYGFSNEDAFLAGGLAGAVTPTVTLTLRRLGWGADLDGERPRFSSYPFAWLSGFLAGGLVAAAGAILARIGRPDGR
jgi:hypothetical protein